MKKVLLVSAIALGLSSVAMANGLSEPMAAAPVATATTVSDDAPGIYVGIQGGYADTGWKARDVKDDNLSFSHDTGIAGRLSMGYDVNKYFALEAGYFLVGQKVGINEEVYANGKKIIDTNLSDIRMQAFDLLAKIKAPLLDNAGLYAKIGPGYLMTSGRNKLQIPGYWNDKSDKFDLVYGFGAYYNFASNWTADLSYTRYNSGHTKLDKDWQPVVDFYAVGVSYKFNLPV